MRTWVLALMLAAGCGPVAYVNQVTRAASSKVDRARQLDAARHSPYWWTRATAYLRMAREVAAHADFQGANRFGRLSAEAADNAIAESEASSKPAARNVDAVAPAKE